MQLRIAFFFFLIIHPVLTNPLSWADATGSPADIRPEGWALISQEAGIVLQAQPIPGRHCLAYRAKGILRAPIEQILEVLSDTTAASEWIPDLARQRVIAAVSPVELITLSVYAVPFPFADRELLLHNQLRLDPKRGALLAESTSIDHPQVPVNGRHVRAHMFRGQTWLRPVDAHRTEVEFVLMVEPRGRIPAFLADFGVRRTPIKLLRALENRAQRSDYSLRLAYRDLLRQLAAVGQLSQKND